MKVMKFNGTIKIRGNDIVIAIPKIGEFYLDANSCLQCIPTENILKAANFPKHKSVKIELREHENGLLVFKYSKKLTSLVISGFYFNNLCIERFYNENSDDQLLVKHLIASGVLHSQVVSYNLYINGILINAFEYELSEHANQHHHPNIRN